MKLGDISLTYKWASHAALASLNYDGEDKLRAWLSSHLPAHGRHYKNTQLLWTSASFPICRQLLPIWIWHGWWSLFLGHLFITLFVYYWQVDQWQVHSLSLNFLPFLKGSTMSSNPFPLQRVPDRISGTQWVHILRWYKFVVNSIPLSHKTRLLNCEHIFAFLLHKIWAL